jgi:hypothetical protein
VEWQHSEYNEFSPYDSDEDIELPTEQVIVQGRDKHIVQMMTELYNHHACETSIRDYSTYLYPGILTEYEAEWVASPLKNPHTIRVFAHFLSATAVSISIFDRPSRNSSAFFGESSLLDHKQGLWTYKLPVLALSHQGLLHSMLALSSLHISQLQREAPTPSLKHLTYAIKRIHRCVGNKDKRHNISTLAATLLLGFYEVMTADHTRWCRHLSGASQLLQEMDFQELAAWARIAQEEEQAAQDNQQQINGGHLGPMLSHGLHAHPYVLDNALITTIINRRFEIRPPQRPKPASFDLEKFNILQDLFWWYARQDAYQSFIAGNRLW